MMARLEIQSENQVGESSYDIVVEQYSNPPGWVRLVVSRYDGETDEPSASQGIDLTPAECAVLGAHLTALAGI